MSSKSAYMRAILSVSDKAGLADLGAGLAALGVELVSTGGTARALSAAGLPVVGISDVTGFPEMMDGRVKTLHPNIHAGILARRNRPDDLAALAAHGITPVDLVVVNLYPFANAAANPATPFDDLVEEIDIGGPSLVRAAAKNFRDVLVVVDPADYPRVLDAASASGRPCARVPVRADAEGLRPHGPVRFDHCDDARRDRGPGRRHEAPSRLRMTPCQRPKPLRYGENPHQAASWIVLPEPRRRTVAGAPGEGALVHEPARPRCGRAHRARVRRAGGGRDQAHEPLRRGDRVDARRRLRSRARRGSAFGVRRHRWTQPCARRGDRKSDHVDVHRSGHRAGVVGRGAADPRDEAEPARRDRRFRAAGAPGVEPGHQPGDALDSRRRADAGARSRARGARTVARRESLPGS